MSKGVTWVSSSIRLFFLTNCPFSWLTDFYEIHKNWNNYAKIQAKISFICIRKLSQKEPGIVGFSLLWTIQYCTSELYVESTDVACKSKQINKWLTKTKEIRGTVTTFKRISNTNGHKFIWRIMHGMIHHHKNHN